MYPWTFYDVETLSEAEFRELRDKIDAYSEKYIKIREPNIDKYGDVTLPKGSILLDTEDVETLAHVLKVNLRPLVRKAKKNEAEGPKRLPYIIADVLRKSVRRCGSFWKGADEFLKACGVDPDADPDADDMDPAHIGTVKAFPETEEEWDNRIDEHWSRITRECHIARLEEEQDD